MKFALVIELGNDAMTTAEDVRAALKGVLRSDRALRVGDKKNIYDENGNHVGQWEISQNNS